jgi:hypothetical protein
VWLAVGVTENVGVMVGVSLGVGVSVWVGVNEGVGVLVGVPDPVGVGVSDGVGELVGVWLGVGVLLDVAVALGSGVDVPVGGIAVGAGVPVLVLVSTGVSPGPTSVAVGVADCARTRTCIRNMKLRRRASRTSAESGYSPGRMRAGANTRMTRVRAVKLLMSPGSSDVTGATVTPRDQSVMCGERISPVEW